MNLQVILPKVPGLGIYQIDTGSIHSIMNINNCATMIRAMVGRVSWVPLVLALEPTVVNNPDDGKKKTVYCMQLRYERSVVDLLAETSKPKLQMLLGKPTEDEAPDDRLLGTGTPEKTEEHEAKVQDDIDAFYPRPEEAGRLNRRDIETSGRTIKTSTLSPAIEQAINQAPEQAALPHTSTQKARRDAATVKTAEELRKALFADFGLQPKDQLAELNITSWNELTISPADAYRQVESSRV